MDPKVTAKNVRAWREARQWSQEELSLASGVDVRTIQRLEAGRFVAITTLKALAAAFDSTVEALCLSEEEVASAIADFRKRYAIIEMSPARRSSEIGDALNAAEAFQFHRIGELSEEQLDQIAEFEATLRDYLDIWRDMEISHRREGEKLLYDMIESLANSKMSVSFGVESLRLSDDKHEPFRMAVLNVAIASGTVALRAVAREKNVAFSFA